MRQINNNMLKHKNLHIFYYIFPNSLDISYINNTIIDKILEIETEKITIILIT